MSTPEQPATASPAQPAQPAAKSTVDLRKLAEKVYRLFQEDLRLERARSATNRRR